MGRKTDLITMIKLAHFDLHGDKEQTVQYARGLDRETVAVLQDILRALNDQKSERDETIAAAPKPEPTAESIQLRLTGEAIAEYAKGMNPAQESDHIDSRAHYAVQWHLEQLADHLIWKATDLELS